MTKGTRNGRRIPAAVRSTVLRQLGKLGFPEGIACLGTSYEVDDLGVLNYDTYLEGSRRPYLTVVVREQLHAPNLLSEFSPIATKSEYVAFTDGSLWSWFRRVSEADSFIPLNEPPPPTISPPGQRWLEPIRDKKAFKNLLRTMNVALRDSRGGGIVERFDTIDKILFAKVFDEREVTEGAKEEYDFRITANDTSDTVSERIGAVWRRACAEHEGLYRGRVPELTEDDAALSRIVEALQSISLLQTPGDIKGLAYEEILRNTFEKNENQQFFTPSEVVEFAVDMAAPKEDEKICDPACGTGGFLVEAFRRARAQATLVGADVDERLAQVSQMNLIMHGADDATIHHLPGLGSLAPLREMADDLPAGSFDLILTNPPFGSDLSNETVLEEFETGKGRASRRRSILFTERCLDLLRPGGRMAIVLDDGVLNLPSSSDVRFMIAERAIVEAVVSLPDVTFMPYSTAKSSILLLRKKVGSEPQDPIFMAEANEVGRRPNGDPLYSEERDEEGRRVLLSDLPGIIDAFTVYKETGGIEHPLCFVTPASLLKDRLDIYHYHPKRFEAEEEINLSRWPTPTLGELVEARGENVKPADTYGDSPVRWLGLGDIEEGTGEYEVKVVPGSKIRSTAHVFNGGDLLFSKLRPNLRKVALIGSEEEAGLCSGEIIVMRVKDKTSQDNTPMREDSSARVDLDYLAFMFRSDLVYGQLMYKVTGVGRPRVSLATILAVRVPLPPLEEQKRIAEIFASARTEAREARLKAVSWMQRSREVVNEAYSSVIAELTLEKGQPGDLKT